jgi:hypothetical protein
MKRLFAVLGLAATACSGGAKDSVTLGARVASSSGQELEHEGRFELGAAAANIMLSIDASKWFKAADSSRLDPRNGEARKVIEANLRASFRAFEDDDEDGEEDRDDRDGGHRGPG